MELTFVILFSIASIVGIFARRTGIPYTIALVLVGLAVGALHVVDPPHLTKELLFALFLPGLVFEAAYNIHVLELRAMWRTIATLAVPGVIAAIALTAGITLAVLHALGVAPSLDWRFALVFAALVAATDPIAVVSLFRRLGVPPRLTTLVEAESLFNDGTSIVVLSLVLAFVSGSATSAARLSGQFALVIGGGAVIGVAFGYGVAFVTRRLDDPMIEITLTTVAAYGSFVIAENVHLSGVIATVSAGLVLGTYGREIAMSRATSAAVDSFWEYVAFALNSIVFLLIGFAVEPGSLFASSIPILVGFFSVVVARGGVVLGTRALFSRTTDHISAAWGVIVWWGGLRGALSMVLALSLPADFPMRELLIDMTYGVVLISIVLQGLTMQPLVARLLPRQAAADVARLH
ncbi:MAG TPA: sodium:proton antiporter [Gemmatimonadaceae bacterium]|jgi:CPA1 family monovalent cation:H+ antiporter